MIPEEVYMDSAGSDYYHGGPGPNIPNLMEMPFQQGHMGPPGGENFSTVTVAYPKCTVIFRLCT